MSWKRWAWRAATFALLVVVGWKIYHRIAPQIHLDELRSVSPAILPLAVSVLLILAANVLHAFLWRRIAVDLGSPSPNTAATLHIYFVSSLSKYLFTLGQIAGLAVVAGKLGMAAGRAAAAAVIGQLIFITTGLLVMGATMPGVKESISWPVSPTVIGILIAVGSVAAVWMVVGTGFGKRTRHAILRGLKGRMAERLGNAFAMVDQARPRDAVTWAAGYLLSWVLIGVGFALFVSAFTPITGSQVLFACGIAAGSFVAGYISPVMAGLGARELAMGVLLGMITPAIPATLILLIAVSSRLWFMSGELLPLLLIPLSGKVQVTPAAPAPPATKPFGAVL